MWQSAFLALALTLSLAVPGRAARQSVSIAVTEPQPATLSGELFTPSIGAPHPAVILLHGCGGVSQNVTAWARWLQSEGYAALVLDSFSGRGLRTLCADPRPLMGAVRAHDVFDRPPAVGEAHGPDPVPVDGAEGPELGGGRVAYGGAPPRGQAQVAD